ncbi:hypothetical protein CDAR_123871 [Caerostris darwini]|uniref:Uncharacterized protein n=1 Tax=Caerostris darwini TaxID=1538125 RepID=A0AAV4TEG6_9ARAC|nr:hypothetical protein CDAR_123871 [Caerostris darwini]
MGLSGVHVALFGISGLPFRMALRKDSNWMLTLKRWKDSKESHKRENVPQINRTAKEDKMLSPKSINLRFCGHFLFHTLFFPFRGNVAEAFVPEERRRFFGGVERRLCGFVRDFGNALSKGSERHYESAQKDAENLLWDAFSNPSIFLRPINIQLESSRRTFRGGIPEIPNKAINATQPRHKIVCFPLEQKLRRRCHGKEKTKCEKENVRRNAD